MIIHKRDVLCRDCVVFIPHHSNISDVIKNNPALKNNDMRMHFIWYQSAEMDKFYSVYANSIGANNKEIHDGYVAEAKLSLMNLLLQIDLFCYNIGWNVDTLRHGGYLHLLDKIEEVEAKGGSII